MSDPFGADELAQRLLQEVKQMEEHHQLWRPTWQQITDYIVPRRPDINFESRTEGQVKTRKIYDSTAVVSSSRLARAMAGVVAPSSTQWFTPVLPFASTPVPRSVTMYLQDVGRIMFEYLDRGGFHVEIQEAFHDLNSYGTTALFMDQNKNGITYRTLHPSEFMIGVNEEKEVVKFARRTRMTIREMAIRYGIENLSDTDQLLVQRGEKLDTEREVVQWIAEKSNYVFGFPTDNFPYASVHIDVTNKKVLAKKGYHSWPVAVARWSVAAGEVYGRGPGFEALPDVATLNKAEEYGLRAWALTVAPPLVARHDGIIARPDVRPLHISYVQDVTALQWFPPPTNLNVETVNREDKRASIRNIFYIDQIQFVPERGKTPATAEEIRARLNVMLQILGPTLTRIERELLSPVLVRTFDVLNRRGLLPEPPPELLSLAEQAGIRGDINLGVDFIGPIASARRQQQSDRLDFAMQSLAIAAQIDPNAVDNVNIDEWLREKYVVDMIPQRILRTREEVEARRQQRAEEQRRLQQQQEQLQQAQVANQLATAAGRVQGGPATR